MKSFIRSFKYAASGIRYIITTQRNFKIHSACALMALFLAALLKFSAVEWAVVIVVIGVVMSSEAMNTAIERAVDVAADGYSEKAKQAKDSAAAAVLIAAAAALGVGFVLYLTKIIKFFVE